MSKSVWVLGLSLTLAIAVTGCGTHRAAPLPRGAAPRARATLPGVIDAARLVRGRTGWVLTDRALSMTADGGRSWTAITPPGVPARLVRGVFFTGPQHGWVVWTGPGPAASSGAQLEISATADGGKSWSASPLGKPDPLFADAAAEPAYIDFVDTQHGWVAADLALTSSSSAGVLFRTSDGGTTWQALPLPAGGPAEFVTRRAGWLACDGQPGTRLTEKFYITSDGGRAWHARTVMPPAGFHRDQATYTIPASGPPANVLAAAFGGDGTHAVTGFYQTTDDGASWKLKATIPMGKPRGEVSGLPVLIDPATWLTVSMDTRQVVTVTHDGAHQTPVPASGLPSGGLGEASFTSTTTGWAVTITNQCAGFKTDCTQTSALYASTDGGAHWSLEISTTTRT